MIIASNDFFDKLEKSFLSSSVERKSRSLVSIFTLNDPDAICATHLLSNNLINKFMFLVDIHVIASFYDVKRRFMEHLQIKNQDRCENTLSNNISDSYTLIFLNFGLRYDLFHAIEKIWGRFLTNDNLSVPDIYVIDYHRSIHRNIINSKNIYAVVSNEEYQKLNDLVIDGEYTGYPATAIVNEILDSKDMGTFQALISTAIALSYHMIIGGLKKKTYLTIFNTLLSDFKDPPTGSLQKIMDRTITSYHAVESYCKFPFLQYLSIEKAIETSPTLVAAKIDMMLKRTTKADIDKITNDMRITYGVTIEQEHKRICDLNKEVKRDILRRNHCNATGGASLSIPMFRKSLKMLKNSDLPSYVTTYEIAMMMCVLCNEGDCITKCCVEQNKINNLDLRQERIIIDENNFISTTDIFEKTIKFLDWFISPVEYFNNTCGVAATFYNESKFANNYENIFNKHDNTKSLFQFKYKNEYSNIIDIYFKSNHSTCDWYAGEDMSDMLIKLTKKTSKHYNELIKLSIDILEKKIFDKHQSRQATNREGFICENFSIKYMTPIYLKILSKFISERTSQTLTGQSKVILFVTTRELERKCRETENVVMNPYLSLNNINETSMVTGYTPLADEVAPNLWGQFISQVMMNNLNIPRFNFLTYYNYNDSRSYGIDEFMSDCFGDTAVMQTPSELIYKCLYALFPAVVRKRQRDRKTIEDFVPSKKVNTNSIMSIYDIPITGSLNDVPSPKFNARNIRRNGKSNKTCDIVRHQPGLEEKSFGI